MEINSKNNWISVALFLIGNVLTNIIYWGTFLFFISMFMFTEQKCFLAHCIIHVAFFFYRLILNFSVLKFSKFLDITLKKRILLPILLFLDISSFAIICFLMFGNIRFVAFDICMFIFFMFSGNLSSMFLLNFANKIKETVAKENKKAVFLFWLKVIGLIITLSTTFFFYYDIALETAIEFEHNRLLAGLALIPIVFIPIFIENYILLYVFKGLNLIKRINYRQIKNMMWIMFVQFVISYILFYNLNTDLSVLLFFEFR